MFGMSSSSLWAAMDVDEEDEEDEDCPRNSSGAGTTKGGKKDLFKLARDFNCSLRTLIGSEHSNICDIMDNYIR